MRRDHPAARLPLDAARYAALNHVVVSALGQPVTPIDAALARVGLARRVSVTLPGMAALPALLETTDVVATVVVDLVESLLDPARFVARPLPLPMPPVVLRMAWHERHDRDPAHRWLREQIVAAMDDAVEPRQQAPRPSARSLEAA
jgi:DNA-binding transcriptional LysR family regulator